MSEAWVLTDREGFIKGLSPEAGALLRVSPRGAVGRLLPLFFWGDRAALHEEMRLAWYSIEPRRFREWAIRPRNRGEIRVLVSIAAEDPHGELAWIFKPSSEQSSSEQQAGADSSPAG